MRARIQHWLIAAAAVFASGAHADFYLVVRADNPQRALTKKEAINLFMGRTRSFSNGEFAMIFDLPRDSPQHAAFYRALTGLSPAQVNSYWSRLMFSGQSMPPQSLPDEATMIDVVKRDRSAIGWLTNEPADKMLRSVLVIEDVP